MLVVNKIYCRRSILSKSLLLSYKDQCSNCNNSWKIRLDRQINIKPNYQLTRHTKQNYNNSCYHQVHNYKLNQQINNSLCNNFNSYNIKVLIGHQINHKLTPLRINSNSELNKSKKNSIKPKKNQNKKYNYYNKKQKKYQH